MIYNFEVVTSKKYFAEISYNGGNYHGWQIQPNALTVQEVLDRALSTYYRQKIETVGCGRTDTGVHASQFFAHFELQGMESGSSATIGINALLPHDIAIKRITEVHPDAHARFDATSRAYEYHLHYSKDPFRNGFSWLLRDQLDINQMNKAAAYLLNYIDFSSFSKAHTQVFTNNCRISHAEWVEQAEGLVFHITADRFLRNMVRAIVGTLVDVGRGKLTPEAIPGIIESKNRSNARASVPACGLYLSSVKYPYI